MTAPFFRFESDFVDSLRCIPMAVRLRLDVTGVKLKLSDWSKLDQSQRLRLAKSPCDTSTEREAYRNDLIGLVKSVSGQAPSLMDPPEAAWDNPAEVPGQVTEKARSLGFDVTLQAWASLAPLQRFALIKLSRPGHENLNFLPALTEFGLVPPAA